MRVRIGVCAVLLVAACNKVDNAQLEKDVTKLLEDGGVTGAEVKCPKDVKAKKGKTFTCDVKIGDKTYAYDVEITEVKGSELTYNSKFHDGVAYPRDKIVETLVEEVGAKIGQKPTIDCGSDALLFATDNKFYCTVTAGENKGKLRIDTDGDNITGWEIEAN